MHCIAFHTHSHDNTQSLLYLVVVVVVQTMITIIIVTILTNCLQRTIYSFDCLSTPIITFVITLHMCTLHTSLMSLLYYSTVPFHLL